MKRHISVVVFVDVVGYTALMQKDEAVAATVLHRFQEIVCACVQEYQGRVLDFYGDGAICSFNTAEPAVSFSLRIQKEFIAAPEVPARIGMHLGSVVEENGRFYGDVVNLASRIESIGKKGSILMSKTVRDQIKNKPVFEVKSLGQFRFKNVAEKLEVFALANSGLVVPDRKTIKGKLADDTVGRKRWLTAAMILVLIAVGIFFFAKKGAGDSRSVEQIEGSSIAVLPFKNFTGNEGLEYFCDGITDDIIGRLTKVQAFDKVISRTSAFRYKETVKNMPEIGAELGVNTILEGSVQQSGDQVKILLQLIDAPADRHIWSTEYVGKWHSNDVFEIQKQVTESVVDQLNLGSQSEKISQSLQPVTANPEAYELFLKAEFLRNKSTNEGFLQALEL
ncbi:MAG: adenylate/guanylate cyclase domain-containing protein, partial [Saprospiraceae bacterium]|nr:adenylate/guanylate cyclase domain-containing protein [Saprospiraceae bacterium]